MSKRVSNICDRIWRAIDHDKDDPVDILNALWSVYTRQVSLIPCDDCREQAVYALEASCPDMLKRANAAAAARAREGECSITCH
jgi:hypothetical protein